MDRSPELKLFNTLGRELQPFIPITQGSVGMYTCGPTVYNFAHIGNLRAFLFDDLLRRSLEFLGYDVQHVMNVTDVGHLTDDADAGEDKMLKSATERGMSVWEIAAFYIEAFLGDLDQLNIKPPTILCRATDHITDMIDLIRRIEANGYTYSAGGNLYFDVSRSANYGALALLDRAKLKSGVRIEIDPNKRNPEDFVLWFTRSKFGRQAMVWDSPWGEGYPGWHIECSAMSMKYLGEQFDIHCGGIDHIPVHHTNEIAQTEAATGRKWVHYWLHNEFLLLDGSKMAKSAGGFITLRNLVEEGFDPLDYRYFTLGAHYRTQLQWSLESLGSARTARLNLLERTAELVEAAGPAGEGDPAAGGSTAGHEGTAPHGGAARPGAGATPATRTGSSAPHEATARHGGAARPGAGAPHATRTGSSAPHEATARLGGRAAERGSQDFDEISGTDAERTAWNQFRGAIADDLNAPRALAAVWAVIRDESMSARSRLGLLARFDEVLGLKLIDGAGNIVRRRAEDSLEPRHGKLIQERETARRNRDFARSDEIRDILKNEGIIIEDTPAGTRWKRQP